MTKKFTSASPRTYYALSELPETEIVTILEEVEPEPLTLLPEENPFPTLGVISQRESELFTQIVAGLSESTMAYGQAVLLMAIYAITVEDRTRAALMN